MTEEIEYAQKTLKIKSEEQFQIMLKELLSNWKTYKVLDSRMKILDSSIKKYMNDNNLIVSENEYGSVVIINQNRRILDRSLIDDIEQYKVDSLVSMMYKSPK